MNTNNYTQLIQKLDRFIKKYYLNRLIKGTLITLGVVLLYFLMITLLENQFYFGKTVRKFFFFSFLGVSGATLAYMVIKPLFHLFSLGKTINHEQAAQIVGDHFVDVKDKLLNVLQLKSKAQGNESLILASIEQKTEEIKLVPFSQAIDLGTNRKYMRYALPPLLLLLFFLVAAPSMIKNSTTRIIHNNKEYIPDAPFSFLVKNASFDVVQNESYDLEVTTEGKLLPEEIFVYVNDFKYRMKKTASNQFRYTFNNVQKKTDFHLESSFVKSDKYKLNVLLRPLISSFTAHLDYPSYTGKKDETLINKGDFTVPTGTKVIWQIETEYTDAIGMKWEGKKEVSVDQKGENLFSFSERILRSGNYKLYLENGMIPKRDSLSYFFNSIADNYPEIEVERFIDSSNTEYIYFAGSARDDYGLRNLGFHYQVIRPDGQNSVINSIPLKISGNRSTKYRHEFDISSLNLNPGERLNYYFEIYDNDAVNGSKSSRTSMYQFVLPSLEELEEKYEDNKEEIKADLNEIKEESKKMKEEIKKLREEIFQEKELEWQKKKELEKLLEKQKELQDMLQEAAEKFKENQETQEELDEQKEEKSEKEKKMEELFDESKNEELQKLMEHIEELQQEIDKEEAIENLEEFEQQMEEMEFSMERLLEMYKQMEVELELEKAIQDLQELAKEQEELAKETSELEKDAQNEEQKEKQEEITEAFEEIKKDIEEALKKNEELKKPTDISDPAEQEEEISEQQEKSMEDMESGENKKAGEKQKKAAEKMEEMAQQMQSSMEQSQEEQMQEDMEMLRQLLENLITLSFEQEDLIGSFRKSRTNTPHYVTLVQEQKSIEDDFKVVEDTLRALSLRVTELESFIIEKVTEINENLDKGLIELEARDKSQAGDHQQRTMKNLNDLALMLNESLENMQQAMAKAKPSAMCNNPGPKPGDKPGKKAGQKPGKVPMDKITQSQEKLGKKMSEQMGKKKGGQKPGSKEFAEMAADQAAIRKALEEKRKLLGEKGKGTKSIGKLVQEMDQIETDLVNKKLTNEMIQRQQNILTRLLEEDRAEREREYDNKRQAEKSKLIERKMPPSLEEYLKQRESEIDVYKTISPELKAYYKSLVEKYYQSLKDE